MVDVYTLPRPHLSPSQVSTYLRCGHQYQYRYILGQRRPPGLALLRGTGVHEGAAHRNRIRMVDDVETPRGDVVDVAVASFDRRVVEEGEVSLDPDEKSKGLEAAMGAARDTTASLAGCFADDVAPTVLRPIAVEESIEIEIPRVGVSLLGIIDIAHEPPLAPSGAVVLEDYKTATSKKAPAAIADDRQLTWYAMAWRHKTASLPAAIGLRQLISYERGPKAIWVPTEREDGDIVALLRTISTVAASISRGAFPPALDGAWWCSRKFCGWYDVCPYTHGRCNVS